MNFINQLNTKQVHVLKLLGGGLIAIIVLAFVGRLFGSTISSFSPIQRLGYGGAAVAGHSAPQDYYGKMAVGSADSAMAELSVRNINPSVPLVPPNPSSVGNEAEAYEVRNYHGVIETSRLQETCGRVIALKAVTYVVFENAHQSDHIRLHL